MVSLGARSIGQLQDNLGAGEVSLSADELSELEQFRRLPEEYPGWMLERQGQYRSEPPVR